LQFMTKHKKKKHFEKEQTYIYIFQVQNLFINND